MAADGWMERKRLMDEEEADTSDGEVSVEVTADRVDLLQPQFLVYPRRWTVLVLYALYCTASAVQWIQYCIIADVIAKYYGVSFAFINWTSMVYMVAYVVTIIPATWFFNKMGLRLSVLLCTGGTCLGAWIKVFSVAPDRFWLGFLGQTVVATSQVYVLSIPAPLAATWFGPDQVSTACAIGVFGLQLGNAIGFFIPSYLVPNGTQAEIERGLTVMFYGVAISCTVLLLLQIVFLRSRPPTPPSQAQAQRETASSAVSIRNFLCNLFGLLRNPNFTLLFFAFSINVAVFSAVTTFLNQMVILHFPDGQNDAGFIGATLIISGLAGTVAVGIVLDRTKKFKETIVVVYAASALAMIAYSLVLPTSLLYIYLVAAVLGFFMLGYIPAAFELAAEVTYPETEATSAGVMSLGCQVLSVLYTLAYGWMFEALGDMASNLVMSGSLLLGTLLTVLVKPDLRRQLAGYQSHQA